MSPTATKPKVAPSAASDPARRRVALLFALGVALGLCVLVGKLAHRQLGSGPDRRAQIEARLEARRSDDPNQWALHERPPRGTIYDRHGRELARTWFASTLVLDPRVIATPREKDEELQAREADPAQRGLRRRELVAAVQSNVENALLESGVVLDLAASKRLRERLWVGFGLANRVRGGGIALINPPKPLSRLTQWWPIHSEIEAIAREPLKRSLLRRGIGAFGFESEPIRAYPYGAATGQIVGTTGPANQAHAPKPKQPQVPAPGSDKGIIGRTNLEAILEPVLAGRAGRSSRGRDVWGRLYSQGEGDEQATRAGCDVQLTIDARISEIALAACREGYGAWDVDGVSAVVLGAGSGDILAAVSWPAADPNDVPDAEAAKGLVNRAINRPYSPGSVIKPMWWARAFDQGLAHEEERWPCGGSGRVASVHGRRVTDTKSTPRPVSTIETIVYSSNVAAARLVTDRLGRDRTYSTLEHFAIAGRIPLPFPGVGRSRFTPKERAEGNRFLRWTGPSLAQGYELMMTPLAMARLYLAFGGNGRLPEPRLIARVREAGGEWKTRRRPSSAVISSRTAASMRRILSRVVQEGTAKVLDDLDWRVGAKTGSALITASKQEAQRRYHLSMASLAPIEAPELVVVVTVDNYRRARGAPYASGRIAGPVMRKILDEALRHLRIPRER